MRILAAHRLKANDGDFLEKDGKDLEKKLKRAKLKVSFKAGPYAPPFKAEGAGIAFEAGYTQGLVYPITYSLSVKFGTKIFRTAGTVTTYTDAWLSAAKDVYVEVKRFEEEVADTLTDMFSEGSLASEADRRRTRKLLEAIEDALVALSIK